MRKSAALCAVIALMVQAWTVTQYAAAQPDVAVTPPERSDPVLTLQKKGAFAPATRGVFNFAKAGAAKCQPWHVEMAAQSDARIVFQVKEPTDRDIVLAARVDEKAHQVLLSDGSCHFAVRIERLQ